MTAFIRLDLFPATVVIGELGEQRYHPARVVITDDAVYVFMDGPNFREPVYEGRLEDYYVEGSVRYAVTDSGDTLRITKASGCGCGSRLRGLRPFPGVAQAPKKSL